MTILTRHLHDEFNCSIHEIGYRGRGDGIIVMIKRLEGPNGLPPALLRCPHLQCLLLTPLLGPFVNLNGIDHED